ncbi:uncharacterized protein LOC128146550 [Harpia harpyja]|uniref:uncharacterized protein LOC128146550 n=1 Tax=Harpia harpyja TaxID=202280 RepID=UPI0022B1F6DD|nr:uncharacterized protein LOC128146550 [Harpia harpyja]
MSGAPEPAPDPQLCDEPGQVLPTSKATEQRSTPLLRYCLTSSDDFHQGHNHVEPSACLTQPGKTTSSRLNAPEKGHQHLTQHELDHSHHLHTKPSAPSLPNSTPSPQHSGHSARSCCCRRGQDTLLLLGAPTTQLNLRNHISSPPLERSLYKLQVPLVPTSSEGITDSLQPAVLLWSFSKLCLPALQCNQSRGFMECHGLLVGTGTFPGLGRPWGSVGAWTGSVTPHSRQLPWAEPPAVTHRVPSPPGRISRPPDSGL